VLIVLQRCRSFFLCVLYAYIYRVGIGAIFYFFFATSQTFSEFIKDLSEKTFPEDDEGDYDREEIMDGLGMFFFLFLYISCYLVFFTSQKYERSSAEI
jgi:hypothetical protein